MKKTEVSIEVHTRNGFIKRSIIIMTLSDINPFDRNKIFWEITYDRKTHYASQENFNKEVIFENENSLPKVLSEYKMEVIAKIDEVIDLCTN